MVVVREGTAHSNSPQSCPLYANVHANVRRFAKSVKTEHVLRQTIYARIHVMPTRAAAHVRRDVFIGRKSMPLCEQTTGWWLWKKPCTRWADGICAHCGGRFCATHTRLAADGERTCRACTPGDESWDTQASSNFGGGSSASVNQGTRDDHTTSNNISGASDAMDISSSDSGGGSDGGSGGSSD